MDLEKEASLGDEEKEIENELVGLAAEQARWDFQFHLMFLAVRKAEAEGEP
jgi:hypothetical protein